MEPTSEKTCMTTEMRNPGTMDLDGLRAIARENGVKAEVLESHKNWIQGDPVKSLEVSAAWMNGPVRQDGTGK